MRRLLLVLLACAALVAGCTGVPTSSGPQTIEQVNPGATVAGPSISPKPGEQPYYLVQDFLQASVSDPSGNSSARAFLTPAAAGQWSDSAVTVLDSVQLGDVTADSVTVFGQVVGKIDPHGSYTPQPQSGPAQAFPFTFAKVNGQYRISNLPSGLLLTEDQLQNAFRQYPLYFFDLADRYLVPDYRWVPYNSDPTAMAKWMLTQLIGGPRTQLQNAVRTDTLPAQVDPTRTSVVRAASGPGVDIEIPGAGQLAVDVRNHLAEQLAEMFATLFSGQPITITDNKRPVTIPQAQGTAFSAADFASALPPTPASELYYLDNGSVYSRSLRPIAGPLGQRVYSLQSVALARPVAAGPLLVAGVASSGAGQRLYAGSQYGGLRPTAVVGRLSRPAFAPGLAEVWVGDGPQIFRVPIVGGRAGSPLPVPPPIPGGGPVLALRISPDGSRIALVVGGTGGSAQLYLGTIVRSGGQVRIDPSLQQISPTDSQVQDVTWLDSSQLFAVGCLGPGCLAAKRNPRTFRVYVDGSDWRDFPTNLASPPDAVTGAASQDVWVSAGGHVWVQTPTGWSSPGTKEQTPGINPVYLG